MKKATKKICIVASIFLAFISIGCAPQSTTEQGSAGTAGLLSLEEMLEMVDDVSLYDTVSDACDNPLSASDAYVGKIYRTVFFCKKIYEDHFVAAGLRDYELSDYEFVVYTANRDELLKLSLEKYCEVVCVLSSVDGNREKMVFTNGYIIQVEDGKA